MVYSMAHGHPSNTHVRIYKMLKQKKKKKKRFEPLCENVTNNSEQKWKSEKKKKLNGFAGLSLNTHLLYLYPFATEPKVLI